MTTSETKDSTYRERAELAHGVSYAHGGGPFGLKRRRRPADLASQVEQWHRRETGRLAPTKGYVYAILLHSRPEHMKVGRSISSLKRLAALQTDTPFKAELVMDVAVSAPDDAERSLHDVLYDYWVSGEWFLLPPEQLRRVLDVMNRFAWRPLSGAGA